MCNEPRDTYNAILAHAQACYPREACGITIVEDGKERFIPCVNMDEKPEEAFTMDESILEQFDGSIQAIVHSHCDRPAKPSEADLVGCEETDLPWLIISIPSGETEFIKPSGYEAPLIGRRYVFGIFDCYTLIRDYYSQVHGIKLPEYTKELMNRWREGEEVYLEAFADAGFKEIRFQDLRKGDAILFSFPPPRWARHGKRPLNHAAIYYGKQTILHHTENRLSSRDLLDGYHLQHAKLYLRHKDLT